MTSPADPATAQPQPEEKWEIADQWQRLWRTLKWAVSGFVCVGALICVGQIYLFQQIFSDIHWALGGGFTFIVTGLAIWFIAIPLIRFFKAPAIAEPPNVDLTATTVSPIHVLRRMTYDLTYLKGLARNPEMATHLTAISQTRADLSVLKDDLTKSTTSATEIARTLADFERQRIAPLLDDLDRTVDGYIQKEALAVGTATAVSLNGSVDAFIVLWRNINMIARISRLYYGRPSLRLSLIILRDVMTAVLFSRALDDVTDAAGEALGGLVTRLGGLVVGPMLDGSVNALTTTKLGYLAKRRCRSFDVWTHARAQRATLDVFEQVKRESSTLVGELIKMCGGFIGAASGAAGGVIGAAAGTAGKVLKAPKSAWSLVQDKLVKKPSTSKPGTNKPGTNKQSENP